MAELRAALEQLQLGPNTEAIHNARVAIKKIRAQRLLFAEFSVLFTQLQITSVVHLFKLLGVYRNWELIETIKQNKGLAPKPDCPLTNNLLQCTLTIQYATIKQCISGLSFAQLAAVEHAMEHYLKIIADDQLLNKFQFCMGRAINKIRRLSNATSPDIHLLRKKIKQLVYWLSMTQLDSSQNEDLKKLHRWLKKAGLWHDVQVVIEKSDLIRHQFLTKQSSEYGSLKTYKKKLQLKAASLAHKLQSAKTVDLLMLAYHKRKIVNTP